MTPPPNRQQGHRVVAVATCIMLPALSTLGFPGCAESSEAAGPDLDARVIVPAGDAGGAAAADGAQDVDAPAVPCAVGNLCRVQAPFTYETVTAISGRSKNDVWASGSNGLLMHHDGQQWAALESKIDEALIGLVLTADETWGVSGTLVVRRGLDAASTRTVRVDPSYGIPSAFGVLPNDEVYLGTDYKLAPLLRLEFDTNTIMSVPRPGLPWSNEEQPVTFRATFWAAGKALWLVGDHAAVARYPLSETVDAGDGGVTSSLGRGTLLPVASHADLLAVWGHGDHLFAAGRNGTVLHFDGSQWQELETGTSATLNAIFGLSPTDIWAAGDSGTVIHFDGNAWTKIDVGVYDGPLRSIWGSSPDDIWIGGEGRLFHWGPLP